MLRNALLVALLPPLASAAQAPTWADDVACIVYSHCVSCHRVEGVAGEHLDLTTYQEAHGHRDDIVLYTGSRLMPPWPPDENYRSLAHERVLTQDEIDIIAAWATADGPQGNMANAPNLPVFSGAWEIADPDVSTRMADYDIPVSATDLYRCFVLPYNDAQAHFIKRLEVVPGNREAVHHVLVFQDTTGEAQGLDAADPGPGYTNFGGIGVNNAPLIGIWAPGSPALNVPDGMGIRMYPGADLVIQVHYPADDVPRLDSTRINLEFAEGQGIREIGIAPALDHLYTITDGPLIIPPNEVRTFHAQFTVPFPTTITAIGPHAHLICTSMKAFAVSPENDTIPLVDIPAWDFHWQGMYQFHHPILLPTGTVLHGEATYDNTPANENNPNDPPAWVTLGEATTNEMMLFYFAYTVPGFTTDTLIVVDDTPHTPHVENCVPDFNIGVNDNKTMADIRLVPVPATDRLKVTTGLNGAWLRLIDVQGREVATTRLNAGENNVDVSYLARGTLIAEVRDAQGMPVHRGTLILQ
ncbi:MAG TPA: hypothetical protein PKK49_10675 [Flavobacteriales bacterium]|nr:hypothetical protein [Flavobacteriales bacterium]